MFERPKPMVQVWQQVRDWVARGSTWIPTPTERHFSLLGETLAAPGVKGDLTPDAHLAALAIEYSMTLSTTDGDFARFPRLRWFNPLAEN